MEIITFRVETIAFSRLFRADSLNRGSRTKDHRARSPFFKLQAKYLSLELATSKLSRETGGISARNGLIQVTYS